jgi:hypothetical protein
VTFSPRIDVRQHGAPPTWADTLSTPGGDPSDMARRANEYRADLVAKRPERLPARTGRIPRRSFQRGRVVSSPC